MSYYYLEIISGVEVGRRFLLADGAISIGRSSQNTIALNPAEKSVSSHHAIIYKSEDRFTLQDLESTNGTFVNNEKIVEQDLVFGDAVGFGKNGPRLKLVVSDNELSTAMPTAQHSLTGDSTSIRTVEDDLYRLRQQPTESTGQENMDLVTQVKLRMPKDQANPFTLQSKTMEMEKKILEKKMGGSDLHKLMKDGKRLDKIIERGNIGQTQAGMLRTVQSANKKSNRQWMIIVVIILVVTGSVSAFFAIRAFQYKALLSSGLTLKEKMDGYEKQIEDANKDPDNNKRKLDSLIMELDQAKAKLSSVKQNVHAGDFNKFYSDPLEKSIDEVLMRFGETDYHIPKEMVARVKYHIGVYTGPSRKTIAKYIVRKAKYFPLSRQVFRQANLPEDLSYISMLESGFNPQALSPVGARGLWQFMPATARRYNLRVDDQIDERTDPEKATFAAAQYFKELIGIFGGQSSLMLCMAAYNAGEGRVMGALRKIDNPMRNRDFWYIYRMGYLAEETNEYIPRVIALLIISEHPEQYGFSNLPKLAPEQPDAENDFIPLDNLRKSDDR